MYDTGGNKHHICMLYNLLYNEQPHQDIHLKKETSIIVYQFRNFPFIKKAFRLLGI